jgi:fatty-acyl-CoA synthase
VTSAPHKTPRHWRFVDGFPLTGSGRIQKFRLREQFAADTTPGRGDARHRLISGP